MTKKEFNERLETMGLVFMAEKIHPLSGLGLFAYANSKGEIRALRRDYNANEGSVEFLREDGCYERYNLEL